MALQLNDLTPQPARAAGHVWQFGEAEFHELRRELRVGGVVVDIESKPIDVLHQLLRHPGEVLTKDELLEAVWPGVAVVDGSLATAVSKLRKALGDEGIIITVPRVGYRLGVPVRVSAAAPPASTALHLMAGQGVPGRPRWRLTRRLDSSPSSEVWLAEHEKTREPRVFKFAPDAISLRGLEREVTVARLLWESLGHRREFVRVLEWNFESAPYFLESEYAGPNLAEWSQATGALARMSLDARVGLLVRIAEAVHAAHELGILHKDLKPGNILITTQDDGLPQVRIADFGSASLLAPARLGTFGITNLGFTDTAAVGSALTGTAMYVAPEVLGGQSPTAASDVYALGVLLYQLAAGDFRRPLAPGWESEIGDALIQEDIAAAACGDAARRLSSAGELAARLLDLPRRRARREAERIAGQHASLTERRRAIRHARRPWLILAAASFVAAVVALALYARGSMAPEAVKTIAVLPFENASGREDLDFLRLALPDEIATILSEAHGVSVRPFATSSQYGSPATDLQQAAREMRVAGIVTGRFLLAGDQLRITLEALDADANRVVWRDQIDAPAGSLLAAQVQIGLKVRGRLAPAFGATAGGGGRQPRSEEAYDLFLRSAAMTFDPGPNPSGIAMLERAVALDPEYPPAWHALSRRYYVESRYRSGDRSAMDAYVRSLERAVALDASYVPAAAGLIIARVERGELLDADRLAVDLVRARPDSVDAHFVLSYVLRFAGLLDEAADHCNTAFMLDPKTTTSGLRSCAMVFLHQGEYPSALNYLNLDRGSDWNKALSIHMLLRQQRVADALSIGSPRIPQWPSYELLLACARQDPPTHIAKLAASVGPVADPETNYMSAAHLAYCGETGAAADILRTAIAGGYCAFPVLDSDPFFAAVRGRAEFQRLRDAGRSCHDRFVAARSRRD